VMSFGGGVSFGDKYTDPRFIPCSWSGEQGSMFSEIEFGKENRSGETWDISSGCGKLAERSSSVKSVNILCLLELLVEFRILAARRRRERLLGPISESGR